MAAEYKSQYNKIMGNIIARGAREIQEDMVKALEPLAASFGGACDNPGDIKGMPRASQKVAEKYDGQWLSIKDMSRATIYVADNKTIQQVIAAVRGRFIASNGWGYVETKGPKGDEDPCGYSDWKVIVSRHGNMAEIQINTMAMCFAKSKSAFLRCFPQHVGAMKARYGVPGGLGHAIYQLYRVFPAGINKVAYDPEAKKIARISALYYDHFRSERPSAMGGFGVNMALASEPRINLAHGL